MSNISNGKLKFLLENMQTLDALNFIDVESLEDHSVKVICRTIIHSVDTLNQLLAIQSQSEALNI